MGLLESLRKVIQSVTDRLRPRFCGEVLMEGVEDVPQGRLELAPQVRIDLADGRLFLVQFVQRLPQSFFCVAHPPGPE